MRWMGLGSLLVSGLSIDWVIETTFNEGGNRFVEETIRRIFRRRAEVARNVALEEIRAGRGILPLSAPDADEAVAIAWRYFRAAEEGTARLNLRLMASVLAGQLASGELNASKFLRWSDLIASLSEPEIVLLATLHRVCKGNDVVDGDIKACGLLVPKYFDDEGDFALTAQSLLRTGLVKQIGMDFWAGPKGLDWRFTTTSRMLELVQLADFEGMMERHETSSP